MTENRVRRPFTLDRLAGFELRTLATQFLLGMILNLYVSLPFPSPLTTAALLGVVVLVLHIIVGIAALGLSLRMIVTAARGPGRRGLALSAITAAGNIVAFLAGLSFTFGDQSDAASFVMTFGFYIAMMASALLLGGALRAPRESPRSGGAPADSERTRE